MGVGLNMVSRRIGDYAVLRELQRGDRELCHAARGGSPRRYLLTLLDLEEDAAGELEEELLRAMELDHPSVMRPVETFAHEGRQVVVFDGPAGTTLERLGRHLDETGGELSLGAALEVGRQLLLGLSAAHDAIDAESGKPLPLVHAELGPHQIFLTWKGEVKVLGLGLSTAFRLAAGKHASAIEAEPYTAPEVRRGGALTVRANVYSASVMLWSLLTGEVPPVGSRRPAPVGERCPDLPRELAAVIDAALVGTLLERRITCSELAGAIEASGLAKPDDLRREMEAFQRAPAFEDTTLEPLSFPPAKLSGVKPQSKPPLIASAEEVKLAQQTESRGRARPSQPERATTQPSLRLGSLPTPEELGGEPSERRDRSSSEPSPSSKGRRTGTKPSMEAVGGPVSSPGPVEVAVVGADTDAEGGAAEAVADGSSDAAPDSFVPTDVAPHARRFGAASDAGRVEDAPPSSADAGRESDKGSTGGRRGVVLLAVALVAIAIAAAVWSFGGGGPSAPPAAPSVDRAAP